MTPLWALAFALALAGQSRTPGAGVAATEAAREKTIAAIHRRAASVEPGSAAAARLGAELGDLGHAYLEEGENSRAIELLSEAYTLDEQNGAVLADLTLSYVRMQDYDSAAFYLRLAEERVATGPPEIYGVLGEVYYALNRIEDAIVAWSESVRLGGQDAGRLRRLQRARDELAVTRGQRSFASDSFAIFSDPAVPEEMVRRAADDLDAAYLSQSAYFGARLPVPQVVVLYAGRAWFSLVSVPDWVSGVFDGKIRVSVSPGETEPGELSAVLIHELAHALIRSSSRDHAPGWLHEGLAQWLEGRRLGPRRARAVVGPHPAASLASLDERFRQVLDRASARSGYAQALSTVEYLAAIRGEGAVACLVASLGEGVSVAEALRAETALSPDRVYSGWKAWAGY